MKSLNSYWEIENNAPWYNKMIEYHWEKQHFNVRKMLFKNFNGIKFTSHVNSFWVTFVVAFGFVP